MVRPSLSSYVGVVIRSTVAIRHQVYCPARGHRRHEAPGGRRLPPAGRRGAAHRHRRQRQRPGRRPGRGHRDRSRARRAHRGPGRRGRPRRPPGRRRAGADVRGLPPPLHLREVRRHRRRAHPRPGQHRRVHLAQRDPGHPLPAAAARRRDPGGAVRDLRHARARRPAWSPRSRAGRGADGQPRLGRDRGRPSTRRSRTRCCSSGCAPSTATHSPWGSRRRSRASSRRT